MTFCCSLLVLLAILAIPGCSECPNLPLIKSTGRRGRPEPQSHGVYFKKGGYLRRWGSGSVLGSGAGLPQVVVSLGLCAPISSSTGECLTGWVGERNEMIQIKHGAGCASGDRTRCRRHYCFRERDSRPWKVLVLISPCEIWTVNPVFPVRKLGFRRSTPTARVSEQAERSSKRGRRQHPLGGLGSSQAAAPRGPRF